MHGPHSPTKHSAVHFALIACVCAVLGLLFASTPSQRTSSARSTRPIDHRGEQIAASNHSAVPVGSFEVCVSEDLPEEVAELSEPIDDDETERVLLQADVVLPFEAPAWESRQCLLEALAVRALTPFRLRAFSGRGSPVA